MPPTQTAGPATTRGAVGVGFTPFETRADVIARVARRADELGLGRVGIAEGWTHDAPILLAEVAQQTSRIDIGTMVVSPWGRTPATIALAAAGLQRCSGGRFSLGLGAGSPPLAEGFHGTAWDRPVQRLRETLVAVRALLAGDRLPRPAAESRALRLWARSRLEEGRAVLAEGESRSTAPAPTRVSVCLPVALAPDEPGARALAAWWLATDEVTLMATHDRAGEALETWLAAGADRVELVLPPGRPEAELLELVEVAAAMAASGGRPEVARVG
jgi:alkanesulfonate monooxygenase SsuD/methylene tetrahydromethanopterin reductase-like flavin-dependent oxidoreductase (luciferase family)